MKPQEYLRFEKIAKDGVKTVEVDPARIMGIIGGPDVSGGMQTFQLELTDRAQRRSLVPCQGSVSALQEEFNRLGPKAFLFFMGVLNPPSYMRREPMQLSAVRIGRIAMIEPNVRHRKAKSIIKRTGLPDVLARETVAELADRLRQQGFVGNGMQDPTRFILHPQHQEAAPPVPPPRRAKRLKDPFTPTGSLF